MEYINKEDIQFVRIWSVKYTPDNVPLWQGPRAAMARFYYFETEEELNIFLEKNRSIVSMMGCVQTIAIKHDDKIYPLDKVLDCQIKNNKTKS